MTGISARHAMSKEGAVDAEYGLCWHFQSPPTSKYGRDAWGAPEGGEGPNAYWLS